MVDSLLTKYSLVCFCKFRFQISPAEGEIKTRLRRIFTQTDSTFEPTRLAGTEDRHRWSGGRAEAGRKKKVCRTHKRRKREGRKETTTHLRHQTDVGTGPLWRRNSRSRRGKKGSTQTNTPGNFRLWSEGRARGESERGDLDEPLISTAKKENTYRAAASFWRPSKRWDEAILQQSWP